MATPDQLMAAIRQADEAGDTDAAQRFAQMYKQATAAPPERSLLGALGEGAMNLVPHAVQAWHAATVDLPDAAINLATSPSARARLAQALQKAKSDTEATIGGYVQQVRDLSSPEFQGSAPRMATAPAQQMEAGVVQKYGVNPAPARLAAALGGNLGQPNLNAYNTLKTDIAEHPLSVAAAVAPVAGKVLDAMGAGARIANAVGAVPSGVANLIDAGATPAAEAVRSSALAKVLAQQQAAQDAAETAARLKAADVPLRSAMNAAAEAQAAQGVAVSDIPEAKALIADLQSKLEPSGDIVTPPTPDQAKAYSRIIDVLSPSSQGQRPSLEAVQNLRREITDPAYKGADPQGFGALGKLERRNLGQQLSAVEDAYTGGLQAPVQQNYAQMLAAQKQAKELGKMQDRLTVQAAQLDTLPPQAAVQQAQTIVTSLAKKGLVSDADYRDFMQLANAATTAQGRSAFRKRIALALGAGVVGYEGARIGGHVLGGMIP